ncbi:protein patched isoform X1 [Neodiprion virginianus]|uniref:protein patched isoform X1 n=1 Tax=Neodiprion virginianus TaxID=2961670 RepID=UPI001EE711C5|nr:protein patched isoform X1 [Neodiprion virginianus]
MVAPSGPTGILADHPSGSERLHGPAPSQTDRETDLDQPSSNARYTGSTRHRHETDLYVRPSWTDAAIALDQLEKGKAEGQRSAVWIRALLQDQLSQLGYFLQRHAGKVLFVAILALATFCVALKSVQVHSRVDQLWVQEGGRLEKEVQYASEALGEAAASTHQLVIQTPKHAGANILHSSALKEHLTALRAATQVTVQLFDTSWRLKDMCYAPSVPNYDMHYVDQIFENIIPCAIITPLDCFWEGSKLLGPEYPVHIPHSKTGVQWTNLNPTEMLEQMKKLPFVFSFKTLEDYMKRSGITNGYQSKPCLDPTDKDCPETAPNKKSQQPPDVGAELTGGCYGFAAKYMHWPEELVVGGAKHNKTGHLTRAAALQTVVQLMGERELYEFWVNTYKVHHIDWSQEKASIVLDTWQRAFSNEIKKQLKGNGSAPYNLYAFSTTTMNDILGKYSEISVVKIVIGCALMVLYAGLALLRWNDPVRSQSGVGIAGVMLVCAAVAAGLGFCALLGIPFNAATTQIVPFLALGLGVHDMFLLTHTYAELSVNEVRSGEQTGMVLKRTGLSVLLTGLSNVSAFFAAAMIPVPALRVFSLQAAILILFNLAAMLLIFPAMVSLDLRRRRSGRSDIFCCCLPALKRPTVYSPGSTGCRGNGCGTAKQTVTRAIPPERRETCTQILSPRSHRNEAWIGGDLKGDAEKQPTEDDSLTGCSKDDCLGFGLSQLAARHYAPFVTRPTTKVFGMMLFAGILAGSAWQATRVNDGLELTDLVPQNSDEHGFLAAQAKHFGFYNMYAVTGRDFEYPNNQRLLYEYHDAFMRVKNVIKNDDGGLPEFWLGLFRDWLKGLQAAFDRDYSRGCVVQEEWFKNASDDAILAYKLMVQTGHVDNPIDKTLINQTRLVDSDGIINPRAFYNYLSAWASNDAFAYGASQANLRPEPRQWFYTNDPELKIPKSMPLTYAQMPFYLHKLTDTDQITELIGSVRELCRKFEERGLPNFPSGIPFLYWEQYMGLRGCLGIALLAALGASVAVVGVLLLNLWAALLVGTSLAGVVLQLLGIMGLCGIKLSAVPAVLLVVSVGIAVHFTVHICLSFVTSIGSRDRRVRLALEHMYAPVVHGALTTLLAVMMLGLSEFDFIVRYFFLVLVSLIGIGLVNGLFFFPILLSLVGPSPEVIPNDHPDRISTPTPPASPIVRRTKPPAPPKRPHKSESNRLHAEPSLTTITEEPNSWHSTQESCIIVQPELKVETTSTCGNQNCGGSDTSGSSRTSPVPSASHITTKVTATANIKVEVHTPLSSGVDRGEKCRHGGVASSRRSSRCSTNVNGGESSGSEPDSDSNANPTNTYKH